MHIWMFFVLFLFKGGGVGFVNGGVGFIQGGVGFVQGRGRICSMGGRIF